MDNYTVYMHVNKTNGKKYIGITSNKPSVRWNGGHGYRGQRRFYSAIVHYGWNGFEHLILETGLAKEEAERREAELIAEHHSNDLRYGYNIENGGVIHKLSDEQKAHLSEVNRGKKHSKETKRKMSASHIGMAARWMTGRKASAETRTKHSEKWQGSQNPRAKSVAQYTLDGELVAVYDHMNAAKEAMNAATSAHISDCCLGKRNKAYGYTWRYAANGK